MSLFARNKKTAVAKRQTRITPPFDNMNNFIVVVLDSCRYDTFMEAAPETIMKLGETEDRYSYASWTAPSHYNLLMGLMPHTSPKGVFASEYYKHDFIRYNERLGAEDIEFKSLVPRLWMPDFLQRTMGYRTHAMVSLPVLNSMTPINSGFDTFRLMDKHNDMNAMLDLMTFPSDRPSFYMLNVGETHYPYARPSEARNNWPRISGVHGVFKHLDDHVVDGCIEESTTGEKQFFDQKEMDLLKARQIDTVKYLDSVFERLFDMVPKNTWITVTADHGELFGEEGYFGHGPIYSKKVFQVPFLEGKIR
ncbi:MAG: sulfatase-like hydrolase/transferase [Candidatus Fermentibacteria bacterium]|nr:sulfatase-like hydrolase/transferase [Candidatus Fermentibacteria bacterium]